MVIHVLVVHAELVAVAMDKPRGEVVIVEVGAESVSVADGSMKETKSVDTPPLEPAVRYPMAGTVAP